MSEIAILAAAGLNAAGTIAGGKAAAKQAAFRAEMLRRQAERTRQEADARAERIRRQRSRESARLRARLLASGVNSDSGSALLSLENLAGEAELDALSAMNGGAFRASLFDADASLSDFRGKLARDQATREAGVTLLRAASR